jgi:protein transport protein SEC61 subunit gamma and related proteins
METDYLTRVNLRIEYMKILQACAMGFVVIGFIGYIIKLVFIPINNIILGA